ncbi:MAG: protein kinase [Nannocystaceae bacterium]
MPTHPDHADDEDDLDLEIEVDRRNAPTVTARSNTGGARFTRGPAAPRAESNRPLVRLLPGRRVPNTRYRLVRWLGEGGMGVVYEAEHEDIERRIALKILRQEASQDPEQAARFREEARAASKIGSPNIVQILDFGELPDGRLMFFMDLLAGQGLDAEIDSAPMDQARLIAILRQVCRGLAAAHDAGIVHRDIKPDNVILVTEDSREDVVKIVDFGIATMLTSGNSDAPAAGTPQYMAPEQILGQGVDGRLDLYSLGCMAYELLTGHPPFHEGDVEQLLEQQLTTQPVPIQQLVPQEQLHPALATVVMRCLAKHPDQRYRDARDLEAALCEAQIIAGLHTAWDDLPLPDVEPERKAMLASKMPRLADSPTSKRRWLWPVIAVVGMAAAAAIAIVLTREEPPEPGEEEIVKERERMAIDAGSRGNWVYPEDPDDAAAVEDTSYRHILQLEALDGSVAALGKAKGIELRDKFFSSLKTQGDKWWDKEGGESFAADFYSQALVFAYSPEMEVMIPDLDAAKEARERSKMTRGMLSEFFRDAEQGSFSADEVQSAMMVNTLAEPDEEVREEKMKQLSKKSGKRKPLSATQLNRLAKLAQDDEEAVADPDESAGAGASGGQGSGDDSSGDDTDASDTDTLLADAEPGGRTSGGGSNAPLTKTAKRDPQRSRKLSSEAAAALASGQRKQAEGLFHQALALDNRNAAALIGLSDIHFDRSNYQQAVQFAKKAVQAAPKKASYRIRLGDAYFKLLRYTDALAEYEAAGKLGSKEASGRIAKVKSRLGH